MSLWKTFKVCTRTVVLLIPVLILWNVSVPPYGGIKAPIITSRPKLADGDNARTEYQEGVRECIRIKHGRPTPDAIVDFDAWAQHGFRYSPAEIAYLEEFDAVTQHIQTGARRSLFQCYTLIPDEPGVDPIELRSMIRHTVARGLALIQQGKVSKGLDLILASYTCGASWESDPSDPLAVGLAGASFRNIASTALFYVLQKVPVQPADLLHISQQVARADDLVGRPDNYLESETVSFDRYIFSVLNGTSSDSSVELGHMPKALRQRSYLELRGLQKDYVTRRQAACNGYDVASLWRADKEWAENKGFEMTPDFVIHHPSPAEMAARDIFFGRLTPAWGKAVALFYLDRSTARGLQALACLKAYRQKHNQYPASLDLAFREASLPVPVDVFTKKPMGYRLNGSEGLAWLPGVDGHDDGGKAQYDPYQQTDPTVTSYDLLYSTNEIPVAFQRPQIGAGEKPKG